MPLYEFECRTCKQTFEDLVRSSLDPHETVECQRCGAKDAVRILSAPALGSSGGDSGGLSVGGGGCTPRGGFS